MDGPVTEPSIENPLGSTPPKTAVESEIEARCREMINAEVTKKMQDILGELRKESEQEHRELLTRINEFDERLGKLEESSESWQQTTKGLKLRIHQLETAVHGGPNGITSDLRRDLERACVELEVNRHIDETRVGHRIDDLTRRLTTVEETLVSEQENSVKLLEQLLTRQAFVGSSPSVNDG